MGSAILACFYTLVEHKQGSKFVYHFIADFNVMYQKLEQNTPTLTDMYSTRYCQHGYMSYMCNIVHVQYNCFLQLLH